MYVEHVNKMHHNTFKNIVRYVFISMIKMHYKLFRQFFRYIICTSVVNILIGNKPKTVTPTS